MHKHSSRQPRRGGNRSPCCIRPGGDNCSVLCEKAPRTAKNPAQKRAKKWPQNGTNCTLSENISIDSKLLAWLCFVILRDPFFCCFLCLSPLSGERRTLRRKTPGKTCSPASAFFGCSASFFCARQPALTRAQADKPRPTRLLPRSSRAAGPRSQFRLTRKECPARRGDVATLFETSAHINKPSLACVAIGCQRWARPAR